MCHLSRLSSKPVVRWWRGIRIITFHSDDLLSQSIKKQSYPTIGTKTVDSVVPPVLPQMRSLESDNGDIRITLPFESSYHSEVF